MAAFEGPAGWADAPSAVEQEGSHCSASVAPSDQVERSGVNVQMVGVQVPNRRSALTDLAVLDGHGLAAFDGIDQGLHGAAAAAVVARRALVRDHKVSRGVGTGEKRGGQGSSNFLKSRDGSFVKEGAGQPGQQVAACGQGDYLGEAQRDGKPTLRAVHQAPAHSLALPFLIDGDSYLLQNDEVAIEGALGAAEFGSGVRDRQSITLVEQANQSLLPRQGPATHRV